MQQLNELKNLVMQNLQKNGYLCNIRAQIRSSVFKAIDSQEGTGKKASPFFTQNLKIQKLVESKDGLNALLLIQQLLQCYDMDHSLKIFNSEANLKNPAKRETLAADNHCRPAPDEPVLYRLVADALPKKKHQDKPLQMPAQIKSDHSEGEIEEEIIKNQSKKFGESEEFGQSQGYDGTVDSLKLDQYDYHQEIQ